MLVAKGTAGLPLRQQESRDGERRGPEARVDNGVLRALTARPSVEEAPEPAAGGRL